MTNFFRIMKNNDNKNNVYTNRNLGVGVEIGGGKVQKKVRKVKKTRKRGANGGWNG